MEKHNLFSWNCPMPLKNYPTIVMGHGSGGKMMTDLIDHLFTPAFKNHWLGQMGDATVIDLLQTGMDLKKAELAFTTDSFVVSPLFFPGGNIGEIAINGTVNDLAMRGANPMFLSVGFILEEGLPMETLARIVSSMADACKETGVKIVTGDTKVIQRANDDGIFINTSGIGIIPVGVDIGPSRARPGDMVIISGTMGDHGIAVMSVREGLSFQTEIKSDTAPLNGLVKDLINATQKDGKSQIHCLRDATRGGLAAVLNELAHSSSVGIEFEEQKVPVRPEVSAACEMLGLDPFYIANEGKLVAIVPENFSDRVMDTLQKHRYGKDAAIIGQITDEHPRMVTAKTVIGGKRIVDVPAGELLPRIC